MGLGDADDRRGKFGERKACTPILYIYIYIIYDIYIYMMYIYLFICLIIFIFICILIYLCIYAYSESSGAGPKAPAPAQPTPGPSLSGKEGRRVGVVGGGGEGSPRGHCEVYCVQEFRILVIRSRVIKLVISFFRVLRTLLRSAPQPPTGPVV